MTQKTEIIILVRYTEVPAGCGRLRILIHERHELKSVNYVTISTKRKSHRLAKVKEVATSFMNSVN